MKIEKEISWRNLSRGAALKSAEKVQRGTRKMNSNKTRSTWLFGLLILISGFEVWGQSYAVDWFSIDGGGGTSTGGVYSVSGTIGQADAGTMSGGNYTLNGGFWGILAAIQTPGAPLLTITRSNTFAIVSWPDTSVGFRLENNNNLSFTNGWATAPQSRSTNNGIISVTVPATSGNNFYRLKNP